MRYFHILLTIIIILVILFFIVKGKTPIRYSGPISNHFNGKIFVNTTPYKIKTTSDLFRWWFSQNKKPWPKHVANLPHSNIQTPLTSNEVRITFINHATVLIQTQHVAILSDPIWSLRASPFTWLGPHRVRAPGIAFDELPKIDVVIISHNHYDHLDIPTLQQLNNKFHPIFIVPLGNKILLDQANIKNVVELDWWQSHQIGKATITLLPSQHWSARWLNDKNSSLWGSYGIKIDNKKIYFAGDTGYSVHFAEIKNKWGTPDLAFLPIGSYRPEWFMQENHLNPEQAVIAHQVLQAKYSVAIHFGTFQLSDEGIDEPVNDLKKALIKLNIQPDTFIVLPEGQSRIFK